MNINRVPQSQPPVWTCVWASACVIMAHTDGSRKACWSAVIGALAASPHLTSPLLRQWVHVSRQFAHPLPPSPPLRSSGAFLNILPVSALSLINVRLRPWAQQQGQYSPVWPPQTLIHLIVPSPIHMAKRKGPRARHERDETEKRARTRHLFLFSSLSSFSSPQHSLYLSLFSFGTKKLHRRHDRLGIIN